ncbi:hypothetical protein BMETH_313611071734, partial [methanotrophic bacterial endosymbiont of Bathymodiolus sp.]
QVRTFIDPADEEGIRHSNRQVSLRNTRSSALMAA